MGSDRRDIIPRPEPPWVLVGVTVACCVALFVLTVASTGWIGFDSGIGVALSAAAVTLGAFGVILARLHWHLTHNVLALWLGLGLLAVALMDHLVAGVLTSVWMGVDVLAGAPGAGRLVLMAGVAVGLLLPEVDSRQRPRLTLVVSVVLALLGALALRIAPGTPMPRPGQSGGGALVAATGALAWAITAVLAVLRTRSRHRVVCAWLVVSCSAWAFASMARALDGAGLVEHSLGPVVLDLVAVAAALAGLLVEVQAVAVRQQRRLHALAPLHRIATDRAQLHETRNALLALQGATAILREGSQQLDETRRAWLADELSKEIAQMQSLVQGIATRDPDPEDRRRGREKKASSVEP